MPTDPKQTYEQTPSKLRAMWDIAMRLIGEYEQFDNRLTLLESKVSELSKKVSSAIKGTGNV